jgi:hypothetical protein
LSISKLLVLAPPGTIDPTPHIYDSTMLTIAGLMAIASVAHALVKPTEKVIINVVAAASTSNDEVTKIKAF